jgi:hypothetical protein
MSLPYFKNLGWEAEVVTVDPAYSEITKDELLLQSIPDDIMIHRVNAFSKKWTSKFGVGSIALRSLLFYKRAVNRMLSKGRFDLIYFSTTQFPVCILGRYWKKKFGVPYVIDMQDPWHSDYYIDKPKQDQPSKYWFSYRLNKYLEPIAMKAADGLVTVSEGYINDLKAKYPEIKSIPAETIPFGAFTPDLEIAVKNKSKFEPILQPNHINIVYIGRGGADMNKAITAFFEAIQNAIQNEPEIFDRLRLYFIGTSYAPEGKGKKSVTPLAARFGIEDIVIEITDRISFYHTLAILQDADALFVPGSDDPKYTASKIYPYLLTAKPLLAIFNSKSPALTVLNEYGAKFALSYDATDDLDQKIRKFLKEVINGNIGGQIYNGDALTKYSAENMTKEQCLLFDEVVKNNK